MSWSLLEGKLGHDAADDITNIRQAFLQVFVRDFLEDFRVVLQCFLKRGPGVDFLVEDDGFDFGVQGRIAQKQPMPPENGRFILAQLLSHPTTIASNSLEAAAMAFSKRLTSPESAAPSRWRGSRCAKTSSTQ